MTIKAQIEDRLRADRRQIVTTFVRDIPLLKDDQRRSIRRIEERQLVHDNAIIHNWLNRFNLAKDAK